MGILAMVLIAVAIGFFVMAILNGFVGETIDANLLRNCVYSIAFTVEGIFILILAYIIKSW